MSKYRFKTKEEFIQDGLWRENLPYLWNSEGKMNKYLGQDIPEEFNDSCDMGVGFRYEGWHFSFNDYVLKEPPVDMKAIQEEAKKRFPIGCSFKNTNGNIYTLKKDDYVYKIYGKSIWAHNGSGCFYQDGKWAELVSLPKEKQSIPEYVECVSYFAGKFTGKIYNTKIDTPEKNSSLSWKQILIEHDRLKDGSFKPSTKEAYEAQNGIKNLTKKDLVEGEIYLYDHVHVAVYPEGPSLSISDKIYLPNRKWGWTLHIEPATEEQKSLLKSEIEKYSCKTTILEEYIPQVGDYVVMEKAGGWSYSPDNNGCIAIVEKVSEYSVNHVKVPSISGQVINAKNKKHINFTNVPIIGLDKEKVFRKALPHEIPSNLPRKDVIKKSESPLEICRQKYKKGMVVKSAEESGMYSGTFTINVDPEKFTKTGSAVDYFGSEGFLYLEGKYAEILSYPEKQSKIENSKWPSDPIVEERINIPSIKKETFIENVQSVDVILRTKRKLIKF